MFSERQVTLLACSFVSGAPVDQMLAWVYSEDPGGRTASSRAPSGRYRRMMPVPFSIVLLLRKSPNLVREPVSPASLSRGVSASSNAWTAS